MSAQLVPLNTDAAPKIPLQRPVLLIGRHPECDIRIDMSRISRRHCCVALAYDRVMIRDLGSRNGLRVNGRLVEEAQLHPGDEVAIGPLIFRMESIPTSRPALPPKPPTAALAKPAAAGPNFDEVQRTLPGPDGAAVANDPGMAALPGVAGAAANPLEDLRQRLRPAPQDRLARMVDLNEERTAQILRKWARQEAA